MANPYPVGSDQYYEEEARQNAAKGQGMDPAQAQPTAAPAPTAAQYIVPGAGGSSQGPATGGGSEGGFNAPPPAQPAQQPPAASPADTMDPSKRVMMQQGAQPQQGAAALPLPPMSGGGGPVRVIPGKRQAQSWATTTERGVQLDPDTQALYRAAEDEQQGALNLRTQAALETNAHMKGESLRQQGERAREWVDDKNRQEARDEQMAAAQAKVEQARKIDPNRLWDNKTAFGKAMDLVGAVAGGILMGMGRTSTNVYLDRMDREAEKDVQLQLKNLDNAEADVKAYYGQWDREDQRIAAGRLAKMQDAKDRIGNMLSGSQDKRVQADLLEAQAALDRKMADDRKVLAKETQGRTVEQRNDVMTKPQVIGGGGGGRDWMRTVAALPADKLKDFWAAYKLNAETPGMNKDKAMEATVRQFNLQGGIALPGAGGDGSRPAPGDPSLFVAGAFGGQGGYARTPQDAEKLRTSANLNNQLVSNLVRIKQLRDESLMNRIPFSDARAEVEALVSANETTLSVGEGLGAISKDDREIISPRTGKGALDVFSPNMDAKLDTAIRVAKAAAERREKDYGVVPGAEVNQGGQIKGRVTGTSAPAIAPGATTFRKAGE